MPTLEPSGKRYSIHDHRFDFSQPEIPCVECHSAGEVDAAAKPPHEFNIQAVRFKKNYTIEEACLLCHDDKDMDWAKETMPTLKLQL